MKGTCRTCSYWWTGPHRRNTGDCRRHAPAPMYSMVNDKPGPIWWPQTQDSFWCGDFLKKSDEEIAADAVFSLSVYEMELSTRLLHAARAADVHTIGDVVQMSEDEWKRIPNVGKRAIEELNRALSKYNLKLWE